MDDPGGIWVQITDGIRDDAYVNSTREAPDHVGLLFTDTNHGVYISYDEGTSWQELNPNLPTSRSPTVFPETTNWRWRDTGGHVEMLHSNGAARRGPAWEITDRDPVLFDPADEYCSAKGTAPSIEWYPFQATGSPVRVKLATCSGPVSQDLLPRPQALVLALSCHNWTAWPCRTTIATAPFVRVRLPDPALDYLLRRFDSAFPRLTLRSVKRLVEQRGPDYWDLGDRKGPYRTQPVLRRDSWDPLGTHFALRTAPNCSVRRTR